MDSCRRDQSLNSLTFCYRLESTGTYLFFVHDSSFHISYEFLKFSTYFFHVYDQSCRSTLHFLNFLLNPFACNANVDPIYLVSRDDQNIFTFAMFKPSLLGNNHFWTFIRSKPALSSGVKFVSLTKILGVLCFLDNLVNHQYESWTGKPFN